jgi:hypothetical protein
LSIGISAAVVLLIIGVIWIAHSRNAICRRRDGATKIGSESSGSGQFFV